MVTEPNPVPVAKPPLVMVALPVDPDPMDQTAPLVIWSLAFVLLSVPYSVNDVVSSKGICVLPWIAIDEYVVGGKNPVQLTASARAASAANAANAPSFDFLGVMLGIMACTNSLGARRERRNSADRYYSCGSKKIVAEKIFLPHTL
jgi:hypothetical protein